MFLRGNLEITAPPLLSTFKIPVYGDQQEATGVSDFLNKIAQFHTGNLSVDHSLSFFFQNKSPGIILGIEQNYLNSFFFSVVVPNYLMDIVYTIFSIFCFLFFFPKHSTFNSKQHSGPASKSWFCASGGNFFSRRDSKNIQETMSGCSNNSTTISTEIS